METAWADKAYEVDKAHQWVECANAGRCNRRTVSLSSGRLAGFNLHLNRQFLLHFRGFVNARRDTRESLVKNVRLPYRVRKRAKVNINAYLSYSDMWWLGGQRM